MKSLSIGLVLLSFFVSSCSRTYYYIVRHGEKEAANGKQSAVDPELSAAGKVRAIVLRDELKSKHITRIFSTNTIRTISTATPLSVYSHIPIQLYNSSDSMTFFINQLKAIKKGKVVIIGHSNTVDDIVNKLCGETKIPGDLPETVYDNFYIVERAGNKMKFASKKYGYPSNPEKK